MGTFYFLYLLLISIDSSTLLPSMLAMRRLMLVTLGFLLKPVLVDLFALNLDYITELAAQAGSSLQDIEFFSSDVD